MRYYYFILQLNCCSKVSACGCNSNKHPGLIPVYRLLLLMESIIADQATGGIIKRESAHLQRIALAALLTLEALIKAWLQRKRMVKICSEHRETRIWGM